MKFKLYLKNLSRQVVCCFVLFISAYPAAKASHMYGADFYYEHVSGNLYKIILDIYGDCSGSAFPSFASSTPQVQIFDSNLLIQTVNLTIAGPGVEVTPVCPADINNTTCKGGTIPGVMKFTYATIVSLPNASANWLFRFTGNFLNNTLAGRSNSITNIVIPTGPNGGSITNLEATLNNLTAPNNAVNYTTIPTPFFCINIPTQYNPGAVDPDNDILSVNLVPGLQTNGNTVTYITPYSATSPLATATGSFSFNNSTGQLSFTPNMVQRSLVVYKVEERRNGIVVGTTMREMTFVVLNNCNNNPPKPDSMMNLTNAKFINPTTVQVCEGATGNISFDVAISDGNGDNVNVSFAGLPAGANAGVAANGSKNPVFSFSWNVGAVTQGNYNFFLTLKDDGCPLASTQTYAYTIQVVPFSGSLNIGSLSGCENQNNGMAWVVPQSGDKFSYKWTDANGIVLKQVQNITTGDTLRSLAPGTYSLYLQNEFGCDSNLQITITPNNYNVDFQLPAVLCKDVSVTFNNSSTSNFSSWEWDFGDGNTSVVLNPAHIYKQTGNFIVTLIGRTPNGCLDTISKAIQIEDVAVSITSSKDTMCEGETAFLTASGAASYIWSPSRFLNCPICPQTYAFPDTATMFVVEGTSVSGCKDKDSFNLFVLNTGLHVTPKDTGVCPGDSVQVHVTNFDSTIRWYPTEGLSDTSAHPWVHPDRNLAYRVVADYKNGCSDTEYINIRSVSNAVIFLEDSFTIYPGESVQFNPQGNCLYYHWFPPFGLSNTKIANPVAQPTVNTRYFATGRTEWGCVTRDSIDIYVKQASLLEVPNAFTPGSTGPNNRLYIIRRGEATLLSFTIFNRWGNKVFHTSNIDEGWDGKYNGSPQPMGVYVYIVEATHNTGKRFYKQGNITLVR